MKEKQTSLYGRTVWLHTGFEVESRRLNPIDGLMPDPTDLPPGCKFRCPKCMDICKNAQPPECVEGTHMIRCHLYQDGPEGLITRSCSLY